MARKSIKWITFTTHVKLMMMLIRERLLPEIIKNLHLRLKHTPVQWYIWARASTNTHIHRIWCLCSPGCQLYCNNDDGELIFEQQIHIQNGLMMKLKRIEHISNFYLNKQWAKHIQHGWMDAFALQNYHNLCAFVCGLWESHSCTNINNWFVISYCCLFSVANEPARCCTALI